MSIIGRLVARPNVESNCGWDLAILIPFKSVPENGIKPNTVYEVHDFNGEILLKEIWKSSFVINNDGLTWAKSISDILRQDNKQCFTVEEVERKKNENEF